MKRHFTKHELELLSCQVWDQVSHAMPSAQMVILSATLIAVIRALQDQMRELGAELPDDMREIERTLAAFLDGGVPAVTLTERVHDVLRASIH